MADQIDERVGATYMIEKDGKRTVVEDATADHPEGNAARPVDEVEAEAATKPKRTALATIKNAITGGEQ
jgi:hypothetical protein